MPVSKVELGPEHGSVMVRHSELAWGMGALVFLHGLGESRGFFLEAFESDKFENYNLFAPDLPGFGNSHGGLECSLASMVRCVECLIEYFEIPECVLVGHGMGGDLALWVAQRTLGQERVRGVISIEGTLCEDALEYGDRAIAVADDPQRTYTKWFRKGFIEDTIRLPHLGEDVFRRFSESLSMCRVGAYLALARDMRDKLYVHGRRDVLQAEDSLVRLDKPKCYCMGGRGLNTAAQDNIKAMGLPHLVFGDSGYWPMIEENIAFYAYLETFVKEHMPARPMRERMKRWFLLRFKSWMDRLPGPLSLVEKIRHFTRTRIPRKIK